MKFCQVSTFLLTIAEPFNHAAPATTNSVLSSSEAKGIIKNQYIVILNKDVGSSNEFAQGIAKQHGGKVLQTMMLYLRDLQFIYPMLLVLLLLKQ